MPFAAEFTIDTQAQPINIESASAGWLRIAGLGPGNEQLMTIEVRQLLDHATDIVGYLPYVARIPERKGLRRHPSDNRMERERAEHALLMAANGQRVVLVSSGDPGVFAMAAAVFEIVAEEPQYAAVDIAVLPGITAMLAAAARLGAPLGHDFCAINLSDNLKPFALIEKRLRLAAQADFAMALYNPRSRSRAQGFERVLAILRQECEPERLIMFARAVSTDEEQITSMALSDARAELADMRTLVLLGSSTTRRADRWIYTPRRS